jgi:hypothetical protein
VNCRRPSRLLALVMTLVMPEHNQTPAAGSTRREKDF